MEKDSFRPVCQSPTAAGPHRNLLSGFSGPKNTGGADLGDQELHKVLALPFWVCSETQGACPAAWDTQWSLCRTGQGRGGVHGLWPKAMTLLWSQVCSLPGYSFPSCWEKSPLSSECSPTKTTSWPKVATSLNCAFGIGPSHHWSWVLRSGSL